MATLAFTLPADREAHVPPEQRGLTRDGVRLLVATARGITHARFRDLPDHLRPGDLVVVNTSATLAAALDGERPGAGLVAVHLSALLDDGGWVVELRPPVAATGPVSDARPGQLVLLPAGVRLRLVSPWPDGTARPSATRLWRTAPPVLEAPVVGYLARYGRAIAYGYAEGRHPLSAYQTVFAIEPGSAEMASAGRPFTDALVTRLVTRGVALAPVTLHAGVSSPEQGEPPLPERWSVPAATARLVNVTRAAGGRVVAVGTTVTRALESAITRDGTVSDGHGWTDLVLGPTRPTRVVDAIVTGWHAPGASHLMLLEAVAGAGVVRRAYDAALAGGYLWHEFGDSALLLP
jgi:S-adenosylmethionine:tRNA ribosyltransferase-isomerase